MRGDARRRICLRTRRGQISQLLLRHPPPPLALRPAKAELVEPPPSRKLLAARIVAADVAAPRPDVGDALAERVSSDAFRPVVGRHELLRRVRVAERGHIFRERFHENLERVLARAASLRPAPGRDARAERKAATFLRKPPVVIGDDVAARHAIRAVEHLVGGERLVYSHPRRFARRPDETHFLQRRPATQVVAQVVVPLADLAHAPAQRHTDAAVGPAVAARHYE
mmetsp:Transcript_12393/g.38157  ORF Transcript_12393/g.38157 Transcript_12393/m.38157 type:complete len:226 (-) Transcript_12393:266-943(-)